jgi:HK97 family phage portal protein
MLKSLFGRFFKNNSVDSALSGFMRNYDTEFGEVSRETILKNSTAWRCINIISDSIASLPFELLDENNQAVKNHQAVRLISLAPNKRQTPYEFKSQLMVHLLVDGSAYIRKIYGVNKKIISLVIIPPHAINLEVDLNGVITYKTNGVDGKINTYSEKDIIHIKKLSYDGVKGLVSSFYMSNAISFSAQVERAGGRFFKLGAFISGCLTSEKPLSDLARTRLRADFENRYIASINSGQPMVLEDGVRYEPIGLTAQDFQMLELRDFQRSEIASFFGVPMHKIDSTKTTSWGTGIDAQNLQFVQDVLQGWVTLIEENISKHLLSESEIGILKPKFDFSGRLRADTQVRTQYNQVMLGGILTPNEIRAAEGYARIPNGDELYPPPNMTKDMNNEPSQTTDVQV